MTRGTQTTRRGLLGAAALPLALAACGGAGTGAGEAVPAGIKEKVTLETWHWDAFYEETLKTLSGRFSVANPNATVSVLITPLGQYFDKLQTSIVGGSPPDLVGIHSQFQHASAASGLWRDLNTYAARDKGFDKADFFEVGLKAFTWKGQQYGIPHDSAFRLYYYNADLFAREGVKTPWQYHQEGKWNWQTYVELATRFRRDTDGDGQPDQFGTTGENPGSQPTYLTFLWQNRADVYDAAYTKSSIALPEAIEAFTWMRETLRLAPTAQQAQTAKIDNGKIAMWQDWHPYAVLNAPKLSFKYGVAPMIAGKITYQFMSGGPAWGIPAAGKSQDATWQLLRHQTTKESFQQQFQIAMMPARKSLDTDQLWASNPLMPKEMRTAFQQGLKASRGVPRISKWNEANVAIGAAMRRYVNDEVSVQAATQDAARETERLLKEGVSDPQR